MPKRSLIAVSGFMAAFIAAETMVHAYQTQQGIPANQKCEDQLSSLIIQHDLPGNGASNYNPWFKLCSYKYYDYKLQNVDIDENRKIKTYTWSPLFH